MTVQLIVRLLGGTGFDPIVVVADPSTGLPSQSEETVASTKDTRELSFTFSQAPPRVGLKISIPDPGWSRARGINPGATEVIEQSLKLAGSSDYVPPGAPHPRLVLVAPTAPTHPKPGAVTSATLVVLDLSFLPITRYIEALPSSELGAMADNTNRILRTRPVGYEGNMPTFVGLRPKNGRVRFFEYTLGTPKLWVTAFREDMPDRNPIHLAFFLIPKTPAYTKAGRIFPPKVSFLSLRRYLLSPPLNAPFFVSTLLVHDKKWNQRDTFNWPTISPDCGFIEQIVKCPGPVALVLPIPNGHDYGNLAKAKDQPKPTAPHTPDRSLRGIADGIRRALRGPTPLNLVGTALRGVHLALAGFSSGAGDAVLVLNHNPTTVDEFYWFDPTTKLIASQKASLAKWLADDQSRMLRLVGGNQQAALLALHANLATVTKANHVSVMPPAGFYEGDPTYIAAVAAPVHGGMSKQESFSPVGSPLDKHTPLSSVTELLLASTSPLSLARTTHPTKSLSFRCTAFEAAGFARFKWKQTDTYTPKGKPDLALGKKDPSLEGFHQFVQGSGPGEGHVSHTRHQWAVMGGKGDPTRDAAFEGHLEQCIKLGKLK